MKTNIAEGREKVAW